MRICWHTILWYNVCEKENIALRVHSLNNFTSKTTLLLSLLQPWKRYSVCLSVHCGHWKLGWPLAHVWVPWPFCSLNLRVAQCHLCLGGPASCVTHCKRRKKNTSLWFERSKMWERKTESGERKRQESGHGRGRKRATDRYLDKQRETIIKETVMNYWQYVRFKVNPNCALCKIHDENKECLCFVVTKYKRCGLQIQLETLSSFFCLLPDFLSNLTWEE